MKKFLNSPWTIAIGAAIFSFLLSVGYDLFKGEKLFTTINAIFTWIVTKIAIFFNFEIKVWWILVAIVVLIIILVVLAGATNSKGENKEEFLEYTEDHFRSWNWSWSWKFNRSDYKWHITNLQAHCPQCDTPMIPDRLEDFFQCPRCCFQSSGLGHEKSYEVEEIIIDNLDRKRKNGGQT